MFSALSRRAVERPTTRPRRTIRNLSRVVAAGLLTLAGTAGLVGPASAATSATLRLAPGGSATTRISGSFTDVSGIAHFTVPAKRSVWLALQFRSTNPNQGYRTRARVAGDGTVSVGFSRVVNGAETLLRSESTGVKVNTGDTLYLQGMVTGTGPVKLSVRAWKKGQARPTWQQTLSDGSGAAIKTGGAVRVWSYLSSTAGGTGNVSFTQASAGSAAAASSTGSTPTVTPSSTTGGKPSAATTGVPAGTTLKRHNGNITVTKDGTVLNGLDIHGFVNVKAANVRITNSIVRGGRAGTSATGLITNYGHPGLVIENVDVKAEFPSVYFDGIKGNNFTARRVHVVGNVDSVKIHGDNVTIENSLLENTVSYAHDPYQGGKATHNDNVQILQGKNLKITGNTIRGATNFAILSGAEQNNVNLSVVGNWLDGGHCTLKLQVSRGWSQTATVKNNKFGPNRAEKSCPFTAYPAVHLTASGNVFEANGLAVNVLRKVS